MKIEKRSSGFVIKKEGKNIFSHSIYQLVCVTSCRGIYYAIDYEDGPGLFDETTIKITKAEYEKVKALMEKEWGHV